MIQVEELFKLLRMLRSKSSSDQACIIVRQQVIAKYCMRPRCLFHTSCMKPVVSYKRFEIGSIMPDRYKARHKT